MKTINVKGLIIGEGRPRIVSPIIGKDDDDIVKRAMELASNPYVEILEWRSDKYNNSNDYEKIAIISKKLNEISKMKPLIFSFRTTCEGGDKNISTDEYVKLMEFVAQSTNFDIIDVDLLNKTGSERCIEIAHNTDKVVFGSYHDIYITPTKEDMVKKMTIMHELGADLVKMVVKANSPEDTLTLLSATSEMNKRSKCPFATMAMSNLGLITRICGEVFGSSLTYGFVKKSSARGQIPVEKLNSVLNIIHKSVGEME